MSVRRFPQDGHLGSHRDDVPQGGCTIQWPPEHSEPKASEPPRWGYDEDTQFKPLNDAARVADLSLENRAYKNAQKMLVQTATQQVEEAYLLGFSQGMDALLAEFKEHPEARTVAEEIFSKRFSNLPPPVTFVNPQQKEAQVRNLVMLLRMLIYRLRKVGVPGDLKACDRAAKYLDRENLSGSILRQSEERS